MSFVRTARGTSFRNHQARRSVKLSYNLIPCEKTRAHAAFEGRQAITSAISPWRLSWLCPPHQTRAPSPGRDHHGRTCKNASSSFRAPRPARASRSQGPKKNLKTKKKRSFFLFNAEIQGRGISTRPCRPFPSRRYSIPVSAKLVGRRRESQDWQGLHPRQKSRTRSTASPVPPGRQTLGTRTSASAGAISRRAGERQNGTTWPFDATLARRAPLPAKKASSSASNWPSPSNPAISSADTRQESRQPDPGSWLTPPGRWPPPSGNVGY